MNKPNLFIIGAPKCGTTSMAYYLNEHPNIFVSPFKEPHYFNMDSEYRFAFSKEEYLNNFKTKRKYDYLVDASVWYLYSSVAVINILEFNPNAKFIIMLRNPVSMFYSLHRQLLFSGIENIKSPLNAWNIQEERLKGKSIPYACRDGSFLQYKKVCELGAQVERVLKIIPEKNVHFITIDDLKSNTEKAYLDVLQFLKVELKPLEKYEVINEKKEKRFGWVSNIFAFVNKIKRILNFRKGLGLANFIAKLNRKKPTDKFLEEYNEMKPMLQQEFRSDVALLRKVTGKALNGW